jgi:hypothetical protein
MRNAQSLQARLLQGRREFTLAEPPRFRYLCAPAQELFELGEQIMQEARDKPTEVSVNVARVQILVLFGRLYDSAPQKHRSGGEHRKDAKHTCMFDVFTAYRRELDGLERQVRKPPLREETQPAQMTASEKQDPKPPGIWLGKDYGRAW